MRYFALVIIVVAIATLAVFACDKSNKTARTATSPDVKDILADKRTSSSDDEIVFLEHRFHYPDYVPEYDREYLIENLHIPHRTSAAEMFSIGAYLCYYYYGFFPETIEEMYELGLVPYEVDPETYDFVKWDLSYGFFAEPGSPDPESPDRIRLRKPLPLAMAKPKMQMQYRYQLMLRVFDSTWTRSQGFSFGGAEVYMPGNLKDCGRRIFKEWSLNEKFFTNPYTRKPMTQVPLKTPKPGDFSCIVTEEDWYEVIFHGA
ncbi:hypothetical protein J7K50_05670 [bacterium]|nr:hypothetical protein [bacterium]